MLRLLLLLLLGLPPPPPRLHLEENSVICYELSREMVGKWRTFYDDDDDDGGDEEEEVGGGEISLSFSRSLALPGEMTMPASSGTHSLLSLL